MLAVELRVLLLALFHMRLTSNDVILSGFNTLAISASREDLLFHFSDLLIVALVLLFNVDLFLQQSLNFGF